VRLADVVAASRGVAETSRRLEKIERLADLLKRTPPDEIEIVVACLIGEPRQGRLRVGWAQLATMRDVPAADVPSLEVGTLDAIFDRMAATGGAGSVGERARLLRELLGQATHDEQDFLLRLLIGELRQGALEGVLLEAIARASNISAARVRRATMLAGDIGVVARAAIVDGDQALSRFILQPFKPVQPIRAPSHSSLDDRWAYIAFKCEVPDDVRSNTIRELFARISCARWNLLPSPCRYTSPGWVVPMPNSFETRYPETYVRRRTSEGVPRRTRSSFSRV